jgi:hypothetical protein
MSVTVATSRLNSARPARRRSTTRAHELVTQTLNANTWLHLLARKQSLMSLRPIVLCLVAIAAMTASTQTSGAVFINETDADTAGTDVLEFVELYDGGVGNTALDGLVLVFFNGSSDTSYAAYDLDSFTTDANGFFLLGNSGVGSMDIVFASNSLQNGADAVALYSGNAIDFPNGTAATTLNLLSAVAYDTNDADDSGLLTALGLSTQYDENELGNQVSDSLQFDGVSSWAAGAPTPRATNFNAAPVPEPSTLALAGLGIAVAGLAARRRRLASAAKAAA